MRYNILFLPSYWLVMILGPERRGMGKEVIIGFIPRHWVLCPFYNKQ